MSTEENPLMNEMMDQSGCAASEPFALRVLGDSMEPEFKDGCIIIIDPAGSAESGSYVIAQIDGEYIFRQFIVEEGKYYLSPLNEGYPRQEVEGASVIRGVIVQRAGARRSQHKHYV